DGAHRRAGGVEPGPRPGRRAAVRRDRAGGHRPAEQRRHHRPGAGRGNGRRGVCAMRRPALGALLVLVWVLLWDRLTVGQVLAGMVVAAALLAVLRPPASGAGALSRPRAAALVRLFVWFAGQFAVSNLQVARAA